MVLLVAGGGWAATLARGSAGVFGALSLIAIVLLLFKSIEDVFNEIWGVRRGRSLVMRELFALRLNGFQRLRRIARSQIRRETRGSRARLDLPDQLFAGGRVG